MGTFEIVPDTITIYRVRFHHRNGTHSYFYRQSLDAAVRRAAWRKIFDKYQEWKWLPDGLALNFQSERRPTYLPECSCYGGGDWQDCELHNRIDGYYARLHSRYVRFCLHILRDAGAVG